MQQQKIGNNNEYREWPLLALLVICPLLIFQDLVTTSYDYVPKMILFFGSITYFVLSLRQSSMKRCKFVLTIHIVVYLTVSTFLIIQAIRPIFGEHQRFGTFWWPLHFLIIGAIAVVESQRFFISKKNLIINVFLASLLGYLIIATSLTFAPGNEVEILGWVFSSKTVLLLPAIVFFPLVTYSIARGNKLQLLSGAIVYLLGLFLAVRLTDRAILITLLLLFVIAIPVFFINRVKTKKQLIIFALSFVTAFGVFSVTQGSMVLTLIKDTINVGQIRHLDTGVVETQDIDRFIHIEAALEVISKEPATYFFGFGFRESSYVMSDNLYKLYEEKMPHLCIATELGGTDNMTTFGFSAILVDFGLIGTTLLCLLVSVVLIRVSRATRGFWRIVLLASVLATVAQLFKYNFLHYPLLFLALAPNGIFELFSRFNEEDFTLSDGDVV